MVRHRFKSGRIGAVAVLAAGLAVLPAMAAAAECAAGGLAPMPAALSSVLDNRLVRARGDSSVRGKIPEGRRYAVLAFGARWCGPCRVFNGQVRPIIQAGDAAERSYAWVFVSADRSEREMLTYNREQAMDWLMVPPSLSRRGSTLDTLAGPAIPALVVVDLQSRQIICNSVQGRQRYDAWATFRAFRALVGG
jgi:hypothetical protein